jgi:hypothetical protein
MPRLIPLMALVVFVAGCEDQPTTRSSQPNNLASAPTRHRGPNEPPPKPGPVDPCFVVPPIIKSFDGEVVAKEPDRFWVRGLSGRHYLLIPTHHLTDKPQDELDFINYDQIRLGQKLQVNLSAKTPLAPVYACEGVVLRDFRMPDRRELHPYQPQRDD